MANNIVKVVPQLLAQGLMALRENALTPQLVNRAYEPMAGPEGSTIDVPIPSAITAVAVTPAATPPATADIVPTSVPVTLDRWFEAPFQLSDKEQLEVMRGTIPMVASEAVKSLANEVVRFILALGSKFFGYVTPEGGSPLAAFGAATPTTKDATSLMTVLNKQVAPLDPRYAVLSATAHGNALNVRAFQDASFGGGPLALIEGKLAPKFGFGWFMDQNVQTHTAGTGAGYLVNSTTLVVGDKVIPADTGTGTILVGDLVTFAGHTQTYVVTSALSGGSFSIEPGLVSVPANNAAITLKTSHVMNLGFHRDAIAFATRPLAASGHPGSIIDTQVDPVSGLALRLEVTREHKRDRFSFDILYGAAVIRRELGARLPEHLS